MKMVSEAVMDDPQLHTEIRAIGLAAERRLKGRQQTDWSMNV